MNTINSQSQFSNRSIFIIQLAVAFFMLAVVSVVLNSKVLSTYVEARLGVARAEVKVNYAMAAVAEAREAAAEMDRKAAKAVEAAYAVTTEMAMKASTAERQTQAVVAQLNNALVPEASVAEVVQNRVVEPVVSSSVNQEYLIPARDATVETVSNAVHATNQYLVGVRDSLFNR